MINRIKSIKGLNEFQIFVQFVEFCLVGFTNLGLDYIIYWLLTRILIWYLIFARLISFMVAISWSFIVNHRWIFKSNSQNVSALFVTTALISVFKF